MSRGYMQYQLWHWVKYHGTIVLSGIHIKAHKSAIDQMFQYYLKESKGLSNAVRS